MQNNEELNQLELSGEKYSFFSLITCVLSLRQSKTAKSASRQTDRWTDRQVDRQTEWTDKVFNYLSSNTITQITQIFQLHLVNS